MIGDTVLSHIMTGRPAGIDRCGALVTTALLMQVAVTAVVGVTAGTPPTPPRVLIFSLGDDYGFVSAASQP